MIAVVFPFPPPPPISFGQIGCNFMMRLRDLNRIGYTRQERNGLLVSSRINFSKTVLNRRAIISLKKINSIEEETMKAITKQNSQ